MPGLALLGSQMQTRMLAAGPKAPSAKGGGPTTTSSALQPVPGNHHHSPLGLDFCKVSVSHGCHMTSQTTGSGSLIRAKHIVGAHSFSRPSHR